MAVFVAEVVNPYPSVPQPAAAVVEKHEAHADPVKMEVDR